MIDEEVLGAVLGYKIWKVLDCNMGTLRYCIYPNRGDEPSEYMFSTNIYELTHKMKMWALSKDYTISTEPYLCKDEDEEPFIYWACVLKKYTHECEFNEKYGTYDSEIEGVEDMCKYILKKEVS